MSMEHDAYPHVTYFHEPKSFDLRGIKILFDDEPLSFEECSVKLDVYFSIGKGLQGLVVRDRLHPRRIWSALKNAPHGVESFVLRALTPMLLDHDDCDPLSRRYGPPPRSEAGEFGVVESDSPFWSTDPTLIALTKRITSKVIERPPAKLSPQHILKFPSKRGM